MNHYQGLRNQKADQRHLEWNLDLNGPPTHQLHLQCLRHLPPPPQYQISQFLLTLWSRRASLRTPQLQLINGN